VDHAPRPARRRNGDVLHGLSGLTAGGWPLQSVRLASSDRTSGTGRRRHGTGPVTEADPRWYRTGEQMAWRDPSVVRDDETDGWVMVVRASDTSLRSRPAAASLDHLR
jgi:hypothetical protein